MNVMVEQCSSGCESGWTLYLDHSNYYNNNVTLDNKNRRSRGEIACGEYHSNGFCSVDDEEEEEEEEEDLSMVSDASSGPPHFDHDVFDEDDDEVFCYGSNGGRKLTQSVKLTRCRFEVEDIELDDTASSPMSSSKKKGGVVHDNVQNQESSLESLIDYSSQGFSATHFQGRSANFQERYGFLQSPYPTEQLQQNQW